MGKRLLNALLGRSSKASKLSMVANLAVSRIAILTNLHKVRLSQARSDVIELLHRDYQERALLRVEQVIKEQNALDGLVLIENCCHFVGERAEMIMNTRDFPDEMEEAMSSLIFAASRTGEFPELQEIRRMLISKYGKDFAYSAVELRKNCRVHPKMVQRLSTERSSLEARQDMLEQIAKDNGIALQMEHEVLDISREEELNGERGKVIQQRQLQIHEESYEKFREGEGAFESARAAIEHARNESWDEHSDDEEETTENQNINIVEEMPKCLNNE